jgi:Flp pilus assembly protein TadG
MSECAMMFMTFPNRVRHAQVAIRHWTAASIAPAALASKGLIDGLRFGRFPDANRAAFYGNAEGMAAVEFGIVAMPFFAIILAVLQIGVVVFAQQELETGVEQAARMVLTGQVQQQGLTQAQFQTQVCANLPVLFKCANVMVDLQSVTTFATANTSTPVLTYNAQGNVTNVWAFAPGAPGTIEVLRVMYQWPTFVTPLKLNLANLSNGKRLLIATAVFQNEPY